MTAAGSLPTVFLTTAALFIVLAVLVLYRAIVGPTIQDRLLAVNIMGTKTVVILGLLSVALDAPALLDIALVYALLNFLVSIAVSRFIVEREGVL